MSAQIGDWIIVTKSDEGNEGKIGQIVKYYGFTTAPVTNGKREIVWIVSFPREVKMHSGRMCRCAPIFEQDMFWICSEIKPIKDIQWRG